jgi:biotin carboxylase
MPRVLVLYPGPPSERQTQVRAHADLLCALGIELVLADDEPVAADRELFAEVLRLPPPEHVEEALRVADSVLARSRIDAVFAQSESALPLGSILARRLAVPGITPEAALCTISKHRTRERLAEAGVGQPRFALARSAADVRRFAAGVGYPVVLKGVASALARLVTKVDRDADVEPGVARVRAGLQTSTDIARLVGFGRAAGLDLGCDPRAEFLVEEFVRGAPVESDGVVCRGAILGFGVTEQVLTPPPLFYLEGYLLPADRPAHENAAIERTAEDALRALGVDDTGFSVEMRFEAGAARTIEVNGRLGWDEGFGDLFVPRVGAQPLLFALQVALGMRPEVRRADVACALAYRSHYAVGVVARVPPVAELRALEAAHGVRVGLAVEAGERMHAPSHPDIYPHLAWALATDPRLSRRAYARARAAVAEVRVEIEPAP